MCDHISHCAVWSVLLKRSKQCTYKIANLKTVEYKCFTVAVDLSCRIPKY